MNAMTKLLKQLPGLKSSDDFAAAITDLEREHTEAVAAVGELEAGREAAIFSGGDLGKLEANINEAKARAETLAIAITGATKRREAAVEAEAEAKLVALSDEAGKLTKTLRAELISFVKAAETLVGFAKKVTSLRREIAGRNTELRTAGRGDLAVDDPITSLPKLVGRQVHDPVSGLKIPEFWPPHPDGAAFARLTK